MSTLAAERTRAATLNDQILALERSLSALRAERELVQERLDSYKYPVLTLPNEIVSEIFVHFLPVYPDPPPLTGTLSPTSLTQICRKWRDIALTTPTLWRAACLSIDDPEGIEMDGLYIPFVQQLHELDLWLSRSRCCPFSIEIEETCDSLERDFIVSAQCARWEHLRVSLTWPPFFTIQGPMPNLRHLDLEVRNRDSDFQKPILFPEAPLLRSATLNGIALEAVIVPLRLFGLTGPWPDVTLPHLESLALVNVPHRHFPVLPSGYLETFIVPTLRQLEITEEIIKNPIDSLTSFVSKSGCNLREMYISGERHFSKDAYRRALPSIPLSFDENFIGEGADVAAASEVKADADLEQP